MLRLNKILSFHNIFLVFKVMQPQLSLKYIIVSFSLVALVGKKKKYNWRYHKAAMNRK